MPCTTTATDCATSSCGTSRAPYTPAQGYARVSGRVGVCMVTSGPGATNTVTGLADALMDSTPLVLVTGQVGSSLLGTDAFQETNFVGITQAVTKWNCQGQTHRRDSGGHRQAFYVARSGTPRAGSRRHHEGCPVRHGAVPLRKSSRSAATSPSRSPTRRASSEAARLIDEARRPLVMVGQGVILGNAEAELQEFLDRSGMPVASDPAGVVGRADRSPQYVGMLGMHGNYGPNIKNRDCDLLVAVGMRFDDRVTGNPAHFGENARVIHLEIDPAGDRKDRSGGCPRGG